MAVAFAAVSWLGPTAMHAIILGLDAVALWTIAWGNWRRLGYILWLPLVPFEIAAGQLISSSPRRSWLRSTASCGPWPRSRFTKVWPAVALPLRYWRPFLIALAAFALISLRGCDLWPQWIASLVATFGHPFGPVVPVPWIARAIIAAGLLCFPRPWTRALAASAISPGLYWGQLVVLVAPISLWLARRDFPDAATRANLGLPRHRPAAASRITTAIVTPVMTIDPTTVSACTFGIVHPWGGAATSRSSRKVTANTIHDRRDGGSSQREEQEHERRVGVPPCIVVRRTNATSAIAAMPVASRSASAAGRRRRTRPARTSPPAPTRPAGTRPDRTPASSPRRSPRPRRAPGSPPRVPRVQREHPEDVVLVVARLLS